MNKIQVFDLNLGGILQNASATSGIIDLSTCDNCHKFSVQYIMTATGAPEVTLEYLASNDGINYVAGGIATGQLKGTSLPDEFTPPICRFLKLKATEENVAAVTLLRLLVAIQ